MANLKFAVWPDTHVPQQDHKAVDTALSLLQWYKPDVTVILGDFMDCAPVSHWLKDKRQTLEGQRLAKDAEKANILLDDIQKLTKKIIFLEGNHEDWIRQAINSNPQLEGLIDLEVLLKFKARPKIIQVEEYGGVANLGKLWFTHGMYVTQNHARAHVEAFGRSIVYGHTHDVQLYTKVSPIDIDDKHMGLSLGCLADKNPEYNKNRPNKWVHAVGLGTVRNNGGFNIDPIIISKGVASYAGRNFKG